MVRVMEKRTDKNKELYQKVNQQIAEIAKKKSNEDFKITEHTLKEINPQLFADQDLVEEESQKEEKPKSNLKLLLSITFIILIILIILIVVVILNGKK